MTPPPTTPKRIEKLILNEEVLRAYASSVGIPLREVLVGIADLSIKLNEVIDRLHTIEEERK